ncbi:MAG: hypothetical protein AAFO83_15880 [Cyanobacteria bacterium J06607_13]
MKHQSRLSLAAAACVASFVLTASFPSTAADLPAINASDESDASDESSADGPAEEMPTAPLNLTPEVIEQSPVLQRWLESVPDIREDIRRDPSFVTRLQLGYSYFPSSDGAGGFFVGVEDLFIGQTPLTLSADYQQNFEGDRTAYGADLHYYLFSLGGYFNLSPILGYRHADAAEDYSIDGANVGFRIRVVPSRTGAADFTIDQSWIVGDSETLNVTHLNFGYAITQKLRLSTDLEWQSTSDEGDSRVGLNLEWAL